MQKTLVFANLPYCGIKVIECATSAPELVTKPTTFTEQNEGKNCQLCTYKCYVCTEKANTDNKLKKTFKFMKDGIARNMISTIPNITNGYSLLT